MKYLEVKLSDLVESAGRLEDVSSYSHPDLPLDVVVIHLKFQAVTCNICVIDDTDEIELRVSTDLKTLVENTELTAFDRCIGDNLSWGWYLTNNQGYSDGLKFEFSNKVTIELVVVASSIQQFLLEEL